MRLNTRGSECAGAPADRPPPQPQPHRRHSKRGGCNRTWHDPYVNLGKAIKNVDEQYKVIVKTIRMWRLKSTRGRSLPRM